jgi:hypothetical protein
MKKIWELRQRLNSIILVFESFLEKHLLEEKTSKVKISHDIILIS